MPNIMSGDLTTEDVISGFQKWKEATTTSPSGRNLSLYKSIIVSEYANQPQEASTDSDDKPITFKTQFYDTISSIINMCVSHHLVLPRWKHIVNLMLQKLVGNPRLDKLRVIHLFESDINLWTGIIFGRRALRRLIGLDQLGKEQCGGIPGRSTLDVSAVRYISLTIAHLTNTDVGIFDNDAKACYDRIVMALFYLRSQQLGIHQNAHILMNEWLNTASYYLQTQFGVSSQSYSSTEEALLHGPGQGGKSSPPIWAIVSALLFKCMAHKCDGAFLSDPTGQINLQHLMQAFVDDSTIWSNTFAVNLNDEKDATQDIIGSLTQSAQYWEQLLHASGGSLELSKCFFSILSWRFDNKGKAIPRKLDEINGHIQIIRSQDQSPVTIQALEADGPIRTLGITDNMLLNSKAMFDTKMKKSHQLASAIRGSHLNEYELRTIYRSVYLKRMDFGFEISSLTYRQFTQIQVPVKTAMLHGLGYSSHTPLSAVYTPIELGGIGLQHLYNIQGTSQIIFLLRYLRHPDHELGKYLRTLLRWYQVIAGTGFLLLEKPDIQLPYLPGTWITEIRKFLASIQGHIHIPGEQVHRPTTRNDKYIMEMALQYTASVTELTMINRMCLYLQVITLSELIIPGTHSMYDINHRRDIPSCTHHLWPRQPKPGPKHWKLWKKFLGNTVLRDQKDKRLRHPLGPHIRQSVRKWQTLYIPQSSHVYHCPDLHSDSPRWRRYTIGQKFCTKWQVRSTSFTTTSPPDGIPCHLTQHQDFIIRPPSQTYINAPPVLANPSSPSTFKGYLETLAPWEQALLEDHQSLQTSNHIQQIFRENEDIYVVSDGGCRQPQGSFGWSIATETHTLWQGSGIAMTSYRAEAYGRLAVLCFLRRILEFTQHSISDLQTVKSYCDNEGLLKTEKKWTLYKPTPTQYTDTDHDVLMQIHATKLKLPFPIETSWVKGHQDSNKEYNQLSREAQLNIEADQLASQVLQHENSPCPPFQYLPRFAYLTVNHNTITSDYKRQVNNAAAGPHIRELLIRKRGWTDSTWETIEWTSYKTSRKSLSGSILRFATQSGYDWLPTMARLHKEDWATTDQCMRCHQHIETFDHILRCSHNDANEWRKQLQRSLVHKLNEWQTAPGIKSQILQCTQTWLQATPTIIPYSSQDQIGWDGFFRGFLPNTWTTQQQHFYQMNQNDMQSGTTTHLQRTGTTWATRLIKFIYAITYQAWKIRCQQKDNIDQPLAQRVQKNQLYSHIQDLYSLQDRCYCRQPFRRTLSQMEQCTNVDMRRWITTWETLIRTSHTLFLQRDNKRQTRITDYFQFPRPPENLQDAKTGE